MPPVDANGQPGDEILPPPGARRGYIPPPEGYILPPRGYILPPRGYSLPPEGLQPAAGGLQPAAGVPPAKPYAAMAGGFLQTYTYIYNTVTVHRRQSEVR